MPSTPGPDQTYNDMYHHGTHRFGQAPGLPNGAIRDAHVSTSDPLSYDKVKHLHFGRMSQPHGSNATAQREVVHIARSAGSVIKVSVCPVVAATGNSTVTVDVYKNGASILSATVQLTNSDAAYSKKVATLAAGATYSAGDVIEVVQTVSAGTGTLPQGVCTQVECADTAG